MKKFTLFLIIGFCISFNVQSQTFVWSQCSNFGGGNRYSPFGFSNGSKGYVGGGVTLVSGNIDYNHNDFWEYDPSNDSWTQLANFPGAGRNGSTGFSIGTKGYVTLGWAPAQLNDLWEYDIALNSWAQKTNFGGAGRYDAAVFVVDGFAYVGTGYAPWSSDFWKYDPTLDSWSQIADIGGLPRQCCAGFAIDSLGYVYGGSQQFNNYTNDLWCYSPDSNSWIQKTPFPGNPRTASYSFVMNGKGYIGGGSNSATVYQDFYEYNPVSDSWSQIPDFGGGIRMQGVSFNIGNVGYAGFGSPSIYPNLVPATDFWSLAFTDANNITGKLFYDFNNNQTQDAGEPVIPNKLIYENNTGRIAFSNQNGNYNLAVLDSGNFQVTTDPANYFNPTPQAHNVYFPSINTVDSLNDFAFQAAASINDLEITISPMGAFRPGFDAYYNITVNNLGTTVLSPTVYMGLDTSVTFVSATIVPTTTGADTIVWSLPALNPFQSTSFQVTVNVDASTPIGTEVNCPVMVEPVANDVNTYNNYDNWAVTVTGSFDPNDIAVNLAEITSAQLPSQPWLEYLIRFQNTGTDTAFTVDVANVVPTGVDLSSFELVAASHPIVVSYNNVYNKFSFKFNNILLADSNTNEPASHGFVRYRIKPLTSLTVGSVIENSASIYFDFNSPVLTNTAQTVIVNPSSITHVAQAQQFVVSPTLVKDKLNIASEASGVYKVRIYALNGKTVLNTFKKGNAVIDVRSLSMGIYFVEIRYDNKKQITKIVKG